MKPRGWVLPLILLVTTVGCDRVTKHLAIRLQYAENSGAFLSLGADLPEGIRTAILTVGVALLLILVAVLAIRRHWVGIPLAGAALMWAGGASNLIDRAARGHVVDFLNVGLGSLRTGIFNVADVAVLLGAVMIVFGDLRNTSSAP
jgi:signal peptidase II